MTTASAGSDTAKRAQRARRTAGTTRARIYITLKPGLLDAQGKTIKSALDALGFSGVQDVRMGKYLEITVAQAPTATTKKEIERMCEQLLANPVIERYRIELDRET